MSEKTPPPSPRALCPGSAPRDWRSDANSPPDVHVERWQAPSRLMPPARTSRPWVPRGTMEMGGIHGE